MRSRSKIWSHSILCGCLIRSHIDTICYAVTFSTALSRPITRYNVHFYYNDIYEVQLPRTHRFPMQKYRMVREAIEREFGDDPQVYFSPSPEASAEELSSTHCPQYVQRYLSGKLTPQEVRRTGFPWSIQHVRRSTSSVGGTVAATRALLAADDSDGKYTMTGHIAGGTHHAFYNYGEGFCIFSDIAVAANIALRENPEDVRRIVIIDLDVHQGNGNAVLFQDDPRVFTFSMHCTGNYFSAKQQSNIDLELPPGTGDEEYLNQLKTWLPYLIDVLQPDLVFFQAGVDVFEEDRLGKLSLTRAAVSRRNRIVFDFLRRRRVKCVITMGGGYPTDLDVTSKPFRNVVECHADVYRDCIAACRVLGE